MADNADNAPFKEWEQTRDVLKTFDERIHDLRKYGFSFVTGLMTIEGILLPWTPPTTTQGATGVPDEAKFGILAALFHKWNLALEESQHGKQRGIQ